MESFDKAARFMDELLDFSSDIGEEESDDEIPGNSSKSHHFLHHHRLNHRRHNRQSPPFAEFVEEELEWISNKDAFPMVESLVDILPNHPRIASSYNTNHQSPISVLDNSNSSSSSSANSHLTHGSLNNNNINSNGGRGGNMMLINLSSDFKVPGKARSKHGRKRRKDMLGSQFKCFVYEKKGARKLASSVSASSKSSSTLGRKCLHCGSEKTPQWRAGPSGPKTLCNACGVRYKSGRLCDEYRPASSPTFSSDLHSNSHRKIVEMRRQKMPLTGSGSNSLEIG
ncbi:hypothetical protein SOVF_042210 [Spinacia oleracea]|uniref:GATA transcription factor 1 isoform X2 n=1 Tax=Spinacia oleracea TaxID=3562 RepID=A0A9R0JLI4_SPIOL|nr:GATA transcription factor 1 isoform X2 [Spinacia oleracea]KNA21546.1 hypothetical protein SOVF_042210 [Spinacia oleracea]